MDADVRVWALLIFSLCCCLLKGMITRHFRFRVVYEKSSLRLLWCGDAWVTCVIAEHNTVVYNRAVQNCLCTKITQVNYTRQHKWKIMVNNTKKGKFGIPSRKIPKSRKCPPVQALSVGSPYTVLSPAAQCQNFSVGSPYTASSSSSRVSWSIRKEQII